MAAKTTAPIKTTATPSTNGALNTNGALTASDALNANGALAQFPEFPPRYDMQNIDILPRGAQAGAPLQSLPQR